MLVNVVSGHHVMRPGVSDWAQKRLSYMPYYNWNAGKMAPSGNLRGMVLQPQGALQEAQSGKAQADQAAKEVTLKLGEVQQQHAEEIDTLQRQMGVPPPPPHPPPSQPTPRYRYPL